MSNRYTAKDLAADVAALNEKLAARGHAYRFVQGHRNGYSAIDLATPEQVAAHSCHSMLEGGSPRECSAACFRYVATHL